MSYARWSTDESDVYLAPTARGIYCYSCLIRLNRGVPEEEADILLKTPAAALGHLIAHKEKGHRVPFYAVERLWHEIQTLA